MRVLMVVRPAAGGMKGHVALLSRGLVARGIDVEIAAPEGSDVLVESVSEGLTAWPIAIAGPLSPVADWRAVRQLAEVIRRGGYDLVHAHGFKAGLVARLACRRCGVPVLVTAHNHVLRRADFSAGRKRTYRMAERALAPQVTRWIAISDSIRAELIDDYGLPPERVVVVRNAIDLASFLEDHGRDAARDELGIESCGPVVGTAARLAPQKGLETLIDAMPSLLERMPEAMLVVAGKGPLESDLRVRALALGVDDAIQWLGHVADMPAFFAGLDVYVSPSELEGFSLTLAEGQAAAAAIVATRAGGAAEVVVDGETAVVVEPRDPFALSEAVARLLSDPETRAALGAAGRERALVEFAPERMVAETLGVYEGALADPRGVGDTSGS